MDPAMVIRLIKTIATINTQPMYRFKVSKTIEIQKQPQNQVAKIFLAT